MNMYLISKYHFYRKISSYQIQIYMTVNCEIEPAKWLDLRID